MKYTITFHVDHGEDFYEKPFYLRVLIAEDVRDGERLELVIDWYFADNEISCFFKNKDSDLLQDFAFYIFDTNTIVRIREILQCAELVSGVLLSCDVCGMEINEWYGEVTRRVLQQVDSLI